MKWSFKLGRILGIDVYIHFTFLLLLGFVGLSQALAGGSLPAAVNSMIFFLSLFGCVLLHEYGHALMARRYGIPTKDITLLPIGGVARLERMPDRPIQELWVALLDRSTHVPPRR
jgi:Zn-dependent protease